MQRAGIFGSGGHPLWQRPEPGLSWSTGLADLLRADSEGELGAPEQAWSEAGPGGLASDEVGCDGAIAEDGSEDSLRLGDGSAPAGLVRGGREGGLGGVGGQALPADDRGAVGCGDEAVGEGGGCRAEIGLGGDEETAGAGRVVGIAGDEESGAGGAE